MADFLTGMSNYPVTNADVIRAMSDEELASWIWNVQLGLPRTMGDISDWLQSPAGEESDVQS